ncbi:glycosyltransferase family 4 protein [Mucilaginibacter sp. JRF]|uniref:glycosyltransferase family 4 protein n=1 Tax=Mucilaginibacter sp. JRF TaxID=2780088 RepID=UPI0018810F34|nr:glycosyltransferase family 1 protein [Mucilaginibacter sp. JRF]MBE9583924.1 glycosyltransferase family 4 protein [Mucilaginibacter sp. JRF]
MAQISKPRVLVTLDAMRYPNTGLFHFGRSLGKALLRHVNNEFDLDYFLYPGTTDFDSDPVHRTYLKKYNKFFFINKNKVNLFHFTDQFSRLKPKKVWSGKKILTIHDINQVHENLSAEKLKTYLRKLGERIYKCERIITISEFAKNDVLAYFPDIADRIQVVYNGADRLTVPAGHQPKYKPVGEFMFAIGIVSAKKNFHVLPPLLVGNNMQLIISGIETPYRDQVIAEAKKLGVSDRLILTGPVSDADKAWYYANCKAFVFPSIAEGFGLPVIEAMHFGKPVFVSTKTSLPEVAGDAAYYFNTFDAEDMQQTLMNGLHHFEQNNQAAYVSQYAERYNWDDTAKQYLQIYRECLNV